MVNGGDLTTAVQTLTPYQGSKTLFTATQKPITVSKITPSSYQLLARQERPNASTVAANVSSPKCFFFARLRSLFHDEFFSEFSWWRFKTFTCFLKFLKCHLIILFSGERSILGTTTDIVYLSKCYILWCKTSYLVVFCEFVATQVVLYIRNKRGL